jgi:hypothetical protein
MKFTVGSQDLAITSVERWSKNGLAQDHRMKFVDAETLTIKGSYVLITNTATSNQFIRAWFSAPVGLAANRTYYLLSEEFANGDEWYDAAGTQVSNTAPVITLNGWAYADSDSGPYYSSNSSQVFGPLGMNYRWGGGGEVSGFIARLNNLIGEPVTEINLSLFPDL